MPCTSIEIISYPQKPIILLRKENYVNQRRLKSSRCCDVERSRIPGSTGKKLVRRATRLSSPSSRISSANSSQSQPALCTLHIHHGRRRFSTGRPATNTHIYVSNALYLRFERLALSSLRRKAAVEAAGVELELEAAGEDKSRNSSAPSLSLCQSKH